jgi:AmmeMemoRadiSam system protein B
VSQPSPSELDYPRLRSVEVIQDRGNGILEEKVYLRDPTQLANGYLHVGQAELQLLALLDGSRSRSEIQAAYAAISGQRLRDQELDSLLVQLGSAGFLAGAPFERFYGGLLAEYRVAPSRPLRDPNGYGAPAAHLGGFLNRMLRAATSTSTTGRVTGLVTPHLDFPRGAPCYGDGYATLASAFAGQQRPKRVVILGTNHFGRSRSVVATRKDFATPWGTVATDQAFLGRLEAECGGDLFPYELDHLNEHSIELQVIWLHHLLGNDVQIVGVLCPDPSGPRGTQAGDAGGVDLRRFSEVLGRLVREDPEPTLLLASADLSHIGGYFGDERPLDDAWLRELRASDEAALAWVDQNDPEGFRSHMAGTGNPTKICSVGCLYSLMVALGPDARATRLCYHQAVTLEIDNCVTCAAYSFG